MTSLNNNNIREDVIFKGKVKDAILRSSGSGGLVNVLLDFNARDAAAVEAQSGSAAQPTSPTEAGLSYAKFIAFLNDYDVELTPFEQQYLCRAFDDHGNGVISTATFTRHLTGLNERRMQAVKKAWAALEKSKGAEEEVTRDVLLSTYQPTSQRYSALMSTFSNATRDELKQRFLASTTGCAAAANVNNKDVAYAEFLAFYAGVSSHFGTDEDFEIHVLKSWAADDTKRPTLDVTAREWGPAGDPLALDGPRYVRDALNRQLGLSSKSYNYSHMQRQHPYVEPLPPLNRPDIMMTTTQKTYIRYNDADRTLADPLATRRGQEI